MAEQKKRGRPPKNKNKINEEKASIKMTDDNKNNVKDVSVGDISSRMKNIFGRMQNQQIPYQSFQEAINRHPLSIGGFLNNPFLQNKRLKKSNSKTKLLNKAELNLALENPEGNEQVIRESSMALFYSNYIYQNLIKLNRDVPQFFYYATPSDIELSELNHENFKKDKSFLNTFLKEFNIPLTFKNVSLQVAREGKCSYVFRESHDYKKGIVDFAVLQKLPSDYIKYTGFGSESPLIVSFNFIFFLDPANDVSQWPSWFGEIWNQLISTGVVNISTKNGEYKINPTIKNKNNPDYIYEYINGSSAALYVELPQDIVYTFGSDFGDVLAIPEYSGLFADLSGLDAYKTLQEQTLLTNITNVLTAEVPIEKDATAGTDAAIISPEVIMGLEGDCSTALNSNIFPFFAPLTNFKMHGIDHVPNAIDISLGATRNVMSTAGVSGLINTNDKPSVAMIKGEQMLIESKMEYFSLQYAKFINLIIQKHLDLSHKFNITIWGGVYNWKDEIKTLKELITNGHIGLMPRLLSAYRLTVEDYQLEYKYVKSLNICELSSTNTSNVVGRPSLDDGEIDNDNTANSKEQGGNVSDVK